MTLTSDLEAAKALIDTPEKMVDRALSCASERETPRYTRMRNALENATHCENGIFLQVRLMSHADIMALFDRAIAASKA